MGGSAEALERFERQTAWPMLFLSLAIIPLLLIPLVVEVSPATESVLLAFDWLIWNGSGKAAYRPAAVSLIARIVTSKRQQANALLSTTSSLAGVIGPLIGAALVVRWGAGWAIAVDALSFAHSAALVRRLRGVVTAGGKTASFRESLGEGWHEVRSRTWVLHSIGVFAAFQFLVLAPLQVLGPVVAEQELAGAASWGVVMSAIGVGSFVGAGVALRFRPSRPLRGSIIALAATCPLLWLLAIPSTVLVLVVAGLVYGGIRMLFPRNRRMG